ncbi:MAG: saccharopine dehydrogenase NADP-binding domain-containing protein [Chloroflexota bacterium]|jgi:saccharopine dehydrogenase (NAD+, L-lysine-forming)
MDRQRLLILGGYGNTGRPLAQLLLQETDASLVLAGRNLDRAQALATEFNARFGGHRVDGRTVDAADTASLGRAFGDVDMVVVTSSTADCAEQVSSAALAAGVDYFDVQYSTHKTAVLQRVARQIEDAGVCFITDGGFHPGLPAALIRYLGPEFDALEAARVGSVIKIDWNTLALAPSTMEEFVGEFMDFQTLVFRDGRWEKAGALAMMKPETMDFGREIGPGFGRQYCLPMFLEEMRALPTEFPKLKETGFFVGGFNWMVDWFISPLVMAALKLWPLRAKRPMGRLMLWGLRTFGKPPYGTLLKAEARGQKDGQARAIDLILYHQDGYAFTAIPAAACLLQYLDGSIRRPGLWLQATAVEPGRFMLDMERMGIQIRRTVAASASPSQM